MEEPDVQGHLLEQLDRPRFAIAALALFMLVLLLFSVKLWSDQKDQVERLNKLAQERALVLQSSNEETVSNCFASAIQGPLLRRILKGIEELPLNPDSAAALAEFRRLNELNTSTLRECRQLAKRLHVPEPEGIGG